MGNGADVNHCHSEVNLFAHTEYRVHKKFSYENTIYFRVRALNCNLFNARVQLNELLRGLNVVA